MSSIRDYAECLSARPHTVNLDMREECLVLVEQVANWFGRVVGGGRDLHMHICSTQAAAPPSDNHTYNWGPGKVLCKEHILLLLSIRHLVRRWVVVAVGAML